MARALNPANLTYELQVQRRERIQICMEDGNVPLDRAEEIADAEIGRMIFSNRILYEVLDEKAK